MCLLAAHLLRYRSSLCLHPGDGLLLPCFYIVSLWLRLFLRVGRRQVVFAPSFLSVWSQRPWRSRQIILLPLSFLHVHLQELWLSKFMTLWIDFSESRFGSCLSMFSILGSMQLRIWALYTLAAMDVRVIPR